MKNNTKSLKFQIKYYGQKMDELKKTIQYYSKLEMPKNLDFEKSEIDLYQKNIDFLNQLLTTGVKEITTVKVRVTEYKGLIVIETINPSEMDQDFRDNTLGSIGCSLYDNKRLEISKEALEAINRLKTVGDDVGDIMGDEDHFTWIGGTLSIKDKTCVKTRDYRAPKNYIPIINNTSGEAMKFIDEGKHIYKPAIAANGKKEVTVWLEFNLQKAWKEVDDKHQYTSLNYYTFDFRAWNGYHDSVLSPEEKNEIYLPMNSLGVFRNKKLSKKETLSVIKKLFTVGFDNNIMNPRIDNWRMSMTDSLSVIKEKLTSLK